MSGKNLADKINALITTKPDFYSDEEPEETKAKVVERYDESNTSDDEFWQSKIRKQNIDTLDKIDERYAGKKVLRKDVYSDEDDSTSEPNGSENSEKDTDEEIESTLEQSENELDNDESMSDSEEQDDYNIDINNSTYKQKDSTIKTMSETNVREEVEKGNCIRTQLKFWENLLEMRIKLQKCIVTSNQMPQYDVHKKLRLDADFMKRANETKTKLMLALNNMMQLKDLLLKQYPETKDLCVGSKKRKADKEANANVNDLMNEEIPSCTEDELEDGEESTNEDKEVAEEPVSQKRLKYNDYEKILQENHNSYREYRNSVIKKWNDKTRIATSSVSKNSGQTTLKQIEFAMSDMNKLRKKSQLKRSEYTIVGKPLPNEDDSNRRIQEYDPEIYDDDDFYHQLLRDLIEYKSSDVTDPIQLSKHWVQLQNMRRKMKRKIDTRATKGRKVRYNVHNKLVNFMAPITIYDTWTDTAKNELYNSLFGKIKFTEEQIQQ